MELPFSLLALLSALIDVMGECSSRGSKIKFSVVSRRNMTGHEIVLVNLGVAMSLNIQGREVSLEVEHDSSICGNMESVGLSTVTVASPPPMPPLDYEFFPGFGYYKRHVRGNTWESARRMCLSERAHLAVVNSVAEANLLKQLMFRAANITEAQRNSNAYIGLHEGANQTEFVTVFCDPVSSTGYNVWRDKVQTAGSTCGSIDTKGELVSLPCHTKLTFFCEV